MATSLLTGYAPNQNVLLGAYPTTAPTATAAGTTTVKASPPDAQLITTLGAENPVSPQYVNNGSAPPTGLIGMEQAIMGGYAGANTALNQGESGAVNALGAYQYQPMNNNATLGAGVIDPLNQAANNFTGYVDAGTGAAKVQADLSGANGPEAQKIAFDNYQSSPAMQYQMDQVIKARERSAAARGGLFSGNTGLELNKDLAGVLSQNYQQDFNNLGTIANQGLNAAGQVAGVRGNQAALAANLQNANLGIESAQNQQRNSINANIAAQIAEIKRAISQDRAQLSSQTGETLGAGRYNAGTAIAQNISNTTNAISQALKEQGISISDSMAADINVVSNLLHEAGLQDSADAKTLAQILANISGGQASNLQQGYQNIGNAQAAGILGTNAAMQNALSQLYAGAR